MRSTGWLVFTAMILCAGVWLIVSGWSQPRPSVARAVHHLRRAPTSRVSATDGSLTARVGHAVRRREVAARTERWSRPLRLIGRPVDVHVGILTLAAIAGFVAPTMVLGTLQATGVVSIGLWVPAGLAVATAVVVPVAIHSDALARAADVTIDLRHQLGAYLDMVTMLLAGNTGYEGALDQAARAGDGLLFRELRRRMREVATTGHSLVRALDLVADDYGIVELEQVAATATLSATEGAPVARSLSAKCSTLRSTLAAEQEAAARVRNDKVTPPLVGMALLFMALIIYPALNLN
jgi:tight adherence protein C